MPAEKNRTGLCSLEAEAYPGDSVIIDADRPHKPANGAVRIVHCRQQELAWLQIVMRQIVRGEMGLAVAGIELPIARAVRQEESSR